MARRLRVLLSAFYCSPFRGSESGLGWNVATRLAKYHDVTVLCGDVSASAPTRADLDQWRQRGQDIPGLEIQYVPPTPAALRLEKLHQMPGLWFLWYKAYNLWQQSAFAEAQRLHRLRRFDVTHHLNVIGFREPGYLWRLDAPFLWGPIAGAPMVPWGFIPAMRFGGIRWAVRNLGNIAQKRIHGRWRSAAARAAKVWTVTPEDYEMVNNLWHVPAEPMTETGSSPRPAQAARTRSPQEPLRLCWSGLHNAGKAMHLILLALADLAAPGRWRLDILGDGPENARWRRLADKLGLNQFLSWHGQLPREKAIDIMQSCHALVHSSVKEGTPHVVLEALSLGLPVICHDSCGMGTAVTQDCGLKVPLRSPQVSIKGFSRAVARIIEEPDLYTRLSNGALVRATSLSWDAMVERVSKSYETVAHQSSHPVPTM